MDMKKIRYERLFALKGYENRRIGLEADAKDGIGPALERMRDKVERANHLLDLLDKMSARISRLEGQGSSQSMALRARYNDADERLRNAIMSNSDDLESCTKEEETLRNALDNVRQHDELRLRRLKAGFALVSKRLENV